jgi:hypothetical protein
LLENTTQASRIAFLEKQIGQNEGFELIAQGLRKDVRRLEEMVELQNQALLKATANNRDVVEREATHQSEDEGPEDWSGLPPGVAASTPHQREKHLEVAKDFLAGLRTDLQNQNQLALEDIKETMVNDMHGIKREMELFREDYSKKMSYLGEPGSYEAPPLASQPQGKPQPKRPILDAQTSALEDESNYQLEWRAGKKKHLGSAKAYTGKEDWLIYLNTFNSTARLHRWCDEEKGLELRKALQGDAARILVERGMQEASFEDMCACVNERFNPPENETQYRNELMGLKMKEGEDIDLFASKWRELYNKSTPNEQLEGDGTTSPNLLAQFIMAMNSLRLEKDLMNKKFKNISEVVTEVRHQQVTERSLKSRWGKAATAVYPGASTPSTVRVAALQTTSEEKPPKKSKGTGEVAQSTNEPRLSNLETQMAKLVKLLESNTQKGGSYSDRKPWQQNEGSPRTKQTRTCDRCGRIGHIAWYCTATNHCATQEALRPPYTMRNRPDWVALPPGPDHSQGGQRPQQGSGGSQPPNNGVPQAGGGSQNSQNTSRSTTQNNQWSNR